MPDISGNTPADCKPVEAQAELLRAQWRRT